MRRKQLIALSLLSSATFFSLFLWWASGSKMESASSEKTTRVQDSKETAPVKEKPPVRNLQKKPSSSGAGQNLEHRRFMAELAQLERETADMAFECEKGIDEKLDDKNFIDPRSSFYENTDRVGDSLYETLVHMSSAAAEEVTWLIEDYVKENDPENIEALVKMYSDFQEVCLVSSGVTFLQTAIESCRYKCPPPLKSFIGNVLFDGLPLIMGNFVGAQRILLSLSIMETANRFGPFHLSMSGEIEDLRFRVQRNYELLQEELQHNEGKPGRQSQAFRNFVEENKFLKGEVLNLIENAAERYNP